MHKQGDLKEHLSQPSGSGCDARPHPSAPIELGSAPTRTERGLACASGLDSAEKTTRAHEPPSGLRRGESGQIGVPRTALLCIGGILAVLCVFAALFVGWDLAGTHLFPEMSTGMRHAVLTIQAGIVTAVASWLVYVFTRRQQKRLSSTAERLARRLESYRANPSATERFDNPHLAHCWEVLDCRRTECPMYDSPGERCWQQMALNNADRGPGASPVTIQQCHDCEVYRRSCPDKLTELGESFNNLMFLLERDARQLGRIRAQMVEKEKMVAVGQMAAGIAHEVGNPLSSISSVVQMLKRNPSNHRDSAQLDLIETHIKRISETVRHLVSLARPSPERWERAYIGQIVAEAVELIGFDRRARDVHIDFKPPKSLPPSYALPSQLQQVFINLALNSLDAMPDGGTLTVRAMKKHWGVLVSVEDTGCGISPETGRRVFEPFFTTKEPGRGTGLGLAVSYGIVQKHGGKIDFHSTAGKGTVFTVSLPMLSQPPDRENGINHGTTS